MQEVSRAYSTRSSLASTIFIATASSTEISNQKISLSLLQHPKTLNRLSAGIRHLSLHHLHRQLIPSRSPISVWHEKLTLNCRTLPTSLPDGIGLPKCCCEPESIQLQLIFGLLEQWQSKLPRSSPYFQEEMKLIRCGAYARSWEALEAGIPKQAPGLVVVIGVTVPSWLKNCASHFLR